MNGLLGCVVWRAAPLVVIGLVWASVGCGPPTKPPPEPVAKTRCTKLLRLYQLYVNEKGAGPPNETALKSYAAGLTPKQREDFLIGEITDEVFLSPRDQQPFEIAYGLRLSPTSPTQAIIWEPTPDNGRRWVALNIGYVEQYDEETFSSYRK